MVLSYYVGLLAGAIFFMDAWGPSKEGTPFLESRRFRGLSIILTGGIITPALDYIQKDRKATFFLGYLDGCVKGWFIVFLLGLVLFVTWKLARRARRSRLKGIGEFAFIVLDFIYLGISDNPHLNEKRKSDIERDQALNDAELQGLQAKLKSEGTAPKDMDLNLATQQSVTEYVERLIATKFEKNYNFHDWYYKAAAEYNRNEFEKTIAYAKNALEKKALPDDRAEALMYVAIAYDELGLKELALQCYDRVIDIYPSYPKLYLVWYDKGTSLYEDRQYRKAATAFDKAVALNSTHSDLYYNRGLNYEELHEYSRALVAFESAIKLQPEAESWKRKGDMLIALNRAEEALAAYEGALAVKEDGDGWFYKAETLRSLRRLDEAIMAYHKALELLPEDPECLYGLGMAYHEKHEYIKALDAFGRILAQNPDDWETIYRKAVTLFAMDRLEEALELFDTYLEKHENEADVWLDKAGVLENMDRLEDSLKAYTKVTTLDKSDAVAWYRKGLVLEALSRRADALVAYEKAVKMKPDYFEAWYDLGTMEADNGAYLPALGAFEKVLGIKPEMAGAWYSKGAVLANLGRYDQALGAYEQAVNRDPNLAEAWWNMGVVLNKLGHPERAKDAFMKAVTIKPEWKSRSRAEEL